MTCDDVFEGMEDKYKEFGLTDIYGTFQFNIHGPGGGDWHAICQGDSVRVGIGSVSKPDVTIATSCKNIVKMVEGRLNPYFAFITGRVKVRGNMRLMAKVGNLLSTRV